MTKRCKTCLFDKPFDAFYNEPRVKDGRTAHCIECCNKRDATWRNANPLRNYEYQREWRLANAEHVLAGNRQWRAANREKSNGYSRKWARANREKVRARTQRWAQQNRARVQLYAQERRARETGADGTCTPLQLQARIDFYGGCCWLCAVPYQAIDHVISLKEGGTNWPSNLRPICKSCNSAKGAKNPRKFKEQRAARSL